MQKQTATNENKSISGRFYGSRRQYPAFGRTAKCEDAPGAFSRLRKALSWPPTPPDALRAFLWMFMQTIHFKPFI